MEELVKLAKNKDIRATIELITNMKKEMYFVAKLKLKNEKDVEYAIQKTVIKCYKYMKKLHNNTMFKIWLMRIHINECDKIEKKNKISVMYEEKSLVSIKKCEDVRFDIIIRNLKDEEKIILTLYYYFKYSIKEISDILKENENIINSKIIRARNKIRSEIKFEKEKIMDIEKILRFSANNEINIPNKIEKIIEHTLNSLKKNNYVHKFGEILFCTNKINVNIN